MKGYGWREVCKMSDNNSFYELVIGQRNAG